MTNTKSNIVETINELRRLNVGNISTAVDLSTITRWRIGGNASIYIEPSNENQLAEALKRVNARSLPVCVVGETSNLLFDSQGFDGAIIRVGTKMSNIRVDGNRVVAEGGTPVPHLAHTVGHHGLTGIEHTVGIPGTIGGLVLMNGGSQRKGVGSHVVGVRFIETDGTLVTLSREQCDFSYRSSSLQERKGAVSAVTLELDSGNSATIAEEMEGILASRRNRFPQEHPNCGSTFLSDPAMYRTVGPPGHLIEASGLKGKRVGGAQVSTQHANFINNTDHATSDDVLDLISLIRKTVRENTGFNLNCEVKYVSPYGTVVPAHVEADRRSPSEKGI